MAEIHFKYAIVILNSFQVPWPTDPQHSVDTGIPNQVWDDGIVTFKHPVECR